MKTYLAKIKATKTENTYKTYEHALLLWFPDRIPKFNSEYIISKINTWNDVDSNTKVLRCSILKAFLRYHYRSHKIRNYDELYDILSGVKHEEKIPQYVSVEQYSKIMSICDNQRLKLVMALMFENGLRADEVVSIKVSDYDSENGTIVIRSPKNHCDRLAILTPELNKSIQEYPANGDYLIHTCTGHQYNKANMRNEVKALCTKAGFPELHCHSFRHGSAKFLLDNDVDIATIQNHLGHRNIATTQKYMHIGTKQKEQVRNLFAGIS